MVKQIFAPQNLRAGDYENGAFDPASGFQFRDEGQSIYSDEYCNMDELELIKVAREELRHGNKSFKKKEKEELAKDIMGYEHHGRLREVMRYVFYGFHEFSYQSRN
jgi:hypothetical protein